MKTNLIWCQKYDDYDDDDDDDENDVDDGADDDDDDDDIDMPLLSQYLLHNHSNNNNCDYIINSEYAMVMIMFRPYYNYKHDVMLPRAYSSQLVYRSL